MTDNELLLAISNMMDTKLEHVTRDVQDIKRDIKTIDSRMTNLESRMTNLESKMSNLDSRMTDLESKMSNLEKDVNEVKSKVLNIELTLENEIKPRLNTIESCYTSTYNRYKDNVEDQASMQQDISIMKHVIMEHSEKLNKLA